VETMLEMVFNTGTGRRFRITLDNPRPNLTPAEVQAAMEQVINADIFDVDGGVTEINSAQIITTQAEPILFD